MNAVEVRNLSYRFPAGDVDILREVNWAALEGSVNLVVGPSGAGKTTLLHCLNGLIPHFHGGHFGGEAAILGTSVRLTSPRDLAGAVGTIFQDPESQFVTDSVEDEIVFGMENLAFDRRTMRMRLEETLDLLGIQHLRHRSIPELSGGERQRVALATALATRPQVLVLDEPTSQLDPLAAHDILAAVERLNLDFGITVVVAEHRLDRVLPFAENLLAVETSALRHGPTQEMLATLDDVPPLIAYARHHGWQPVPLTIRDARRWLTGNQPPPALSTTPQPGARIVQVEDLTYQYGERTALDEVSFDGREGDVIALVGKNGSGKTTLLKHLIGLLRPVKGRVLLDGHDIAQESVQNIASTSGYVPQFPTSILHQETVRDEISFTARARNLSVDPAEIARVLGIEEYLNRHPLDLSGGQRQRVALAAIAVAEPRVLLLDEPTRGLPGRAKTQLAHYIREYAAQGRLVIVATHDVEFLAQCASRVLMMADGEIIADGTPAETLSGSLTFGTQMNRLLGGDILSLRDAGVPE